MLRVRVVKRPKLASLGESELIVVLFCDALTRKVSHARIM